MDKGSIITAHYPDNLKPLRTVASSVMKGNSPKARMMLMHFMDLKSMAAIFTHNKPAHFRVCSSATPGPVATCPLSRNWMPWASSASRT